MMLTLALVISFAAGISVGLQIHHIEAMLREAIDALQHKTRVKNSGVVRPGLNEIPMHEPGLRSAVVRPRVKEDVVTTETNTTLASVRNRTAGK